jgi:hypothetical protein
VRLRSSLIQLTQELTEARRTQASNENATPSARSRDAARTPHASVAIHIGDDDDEIGAVDHGRERVDTAACQVPRMAFDAVPLCLRHFDVVVSVSIDSANEPDVHGVPAFQLV